MGSSGSATAIQMEIRFDRVRRIRRSVSKIRQDDAADPARHQTDIVLLQFRLSWIGRSLQENCQTEQQENDVLSLGFRWIGRRCLQTILGAVSQVLGECHSLYRKAVRNTAQLLEHEFKRAILFFSFFKDRLTWCAPLNFLIFVTVYLSLFFCWSNRSSKVHRNYIPNSPTLERVVCFAWGTSNAGRYGHGDYKCAPVFFFSNSGGIF